MSRKFNSNRARLKRHMRMRNRLVGSLARPRLNVFRSGHHIYAQIIDDTTGQTLVAASSLDESLKDFKPAVPASVQEKAVKGNERLEVAAEVAPAKGKGAKAEKPAKAAAQAPASKGGAQASKGKPGTQSKTVLPTAQKGEHKTPLEALVAIAGNRKVAMAREVGKLVARRAQEKGVSSVVFDRGGYAYHGRIAALAEGAREGGLKF